MTPWHALESDIAGFVKKTAREAHSSDKGYKWMVHMRPRSCPGWGLHGRNGTIESRVPQEWKGNSRSKDTRGIYYYGGAADYVQRLVHVSNFIIYLLNSLAKP
jgi:hypothetical protein